MSKIKYPNKRGEIKMPVLDKHGYWIGAKLHSNKTHTVNGFISHKAKHSAWIPCHAYNDRKGFSRKEVRKIIKHVYKDENSKKKNNQKKKR